MEGGRREGGMEGGRGRNGVSMKGQDLVEGSDLEWAALGWREGFLQSSAGTGQEATGHLPLRLI